VKTPTDDAAAAQLNLDVQVGLVPTHVEQHYVCGPAGGEIEDNGFDCAPIFELFLDKVQSASSRKWLTVNWINHLFRSPVVGHFAEFRQYELPVLQQPNELVSDAFVPFSHNNPQHVAARLSYHMIGHGRWSRVDLQIWSSYDASACSPLVGSNRHPRVPFYNAY